MELSELLVARPWLTVTPSTAVLYRTLEASKPTLLLDEVDAIFNPKTAERYEELRAVLNTGFRRGAKVPRLADFGRTVEHFDVYGPKMLAGIGVLPSTITDRGLPIRLQRKTRAERVERFRRRDVVAETEPIRGAIEAWAAEHGPELTLARPALPEELSDRMQEACEPLLAIADVLGYGEEARAAFVELLTADRADEKEQAELTLLRDIREVFRGGNIEALGADDLAAFLVMNGNGWDQWYGRALSSRDVTKLLKPYGIASMAVWVNGATRRGYKRDQFAEAWARYLTDLTDS